MCMCMSSKYCVYVYIEYVLCVCICRVRTLDVPYSGKLWRALDLANQSPERIGEF